MRGTEGEWRECKRGGVKEGGWDGSEGAREGDRQAGRQGRKEGGSGSDNNIAMKMRG